MSFTFFGFVFYPIKLISGHSTTQKSKKTARSPLYRSAPPSQHPPSTQQKSGIDQLYPALQVTACSINHLTHQYQLTTPTSIYLNKTNDLSIYTNIIHHISFNRCSNQMYNNLRAPSIAKRLLCHCLRQHITIIIRHCLQSATLFNSQISDPIESII